MKANFHTHTYRCRHAVGDEREYIEAAVQAGFEQLGFSDHTPWPRDGEKRYGLGMDIEELSGYVESLRALRAEYAPKLDLKIGLECEYFRRYAPWLKDAIAELQLDYVILGNHFEGTDAQGMYFGNITDAASALTYLRMTVEGMETGMYAYLAHPELFLRSMPEWNRDMANVCRELCRAANALHMPVEYNLEGVRSQRRHSQTGIAYPNRHFWDIAAEEGCTAIIGYDAHMPESLLDAADFEAARRLLEVELGMKRIDSIFAGE